MSRTPHESSDASSGAAVAAPEAVRLRSGILLSVMAELCAEVATLHRAGWLHRELHALADPVESLCRSVVRGPQNELRRLLDTTLRRDKSVAVGGLATDPAVCPPELRGTDTLDVPAALDRAARVFVDHGVLCPPARIDVYQLAVVLCRLATGQPLRAYLSSPRVMASVDLPIRQVIDAGLGYDESTRVESAVAFRELLLATLALSDIAAPDASSVDDASSALAEAADSGDAELTACETDLPVAARTDRIVRLQLRRLGHFEIRERIGRGGMGVVYRAYDQSLHRDVAVKVLSDRLAGDPSFVERFHAEAAAAAKLAHPNIVPIHFIGEDQGTHYYAMQLVDGESLAERLARTGRLSVDETLAIVAPLLRGLGAAHRAGLVHRDIKPGNIIIDGASGRVMLTDFGLARSVSAPEHLSESGLVMGTAEYMSPEQARGETVDARSDLYSLGVLLYQLLSGRMPFAADTPSGYLIQHVTRDPRPLGDLEPDIDPQLQAVVRRLMQRSPDDRFQSVDEVAVALGSLDSFPDFRVRPSGDDSDVWPAARSASAVTGRDSGTVGRRTGRSSAVTIPVGADAQTTEPGGRIETPPHRSGLRSGITLLIVMSVLGLIAAAGRRSAVPPANVLMPHADEVTALTFTPDGKYLVSAGGYSGSLKTPGDTALRLWEADTGRMVAMSAPLPARAALLVAERGHVLAMGSTTEDTGFVVAWSWTADNLPAGRMGQVVFTDAFEFQTAAVAIEHAGTVHGSVASEPESASSDDESAVTALAVGNAGLVRITVEPESLTPLIERSNLPADSSGGRVRTMARSAALPGQLLLVRDESSAGRIPGEHDAAESASNAIQPAIIRQNDDTRLSGRSRIVVVDESTGLERQSLSIDGVVTSIALSPDGRRLVTRSSMQLARDRIRQLSAHQNDGADTFGPSLSPDAVPLDFVEIRDWPSGSLRHRFGPYSPGMPALAVSHDGRLVLTIGTASTGRDSNQSQQAVLLDTVECRELCHLETGGRDLTAVAVSPTAFLGAITDTAGRVVLSRFDQFIALEQEPARKPSR